MSDEPSIDPRRLPDPEVQDPDVSRDVELGTATRADFTAPDIAPVADASIEDLVAMLEADAPATRRRALLALADRDVDQAVRERLAEISRTDPDPEARQFAIEALAGTGATVDTIRPGLEDPNPWVRAETIVSLKKSAPEAAVDAFEAALDDPHLAVRRNALISLHHVRGSDANDALLAALEDESERVREWVVRLLADAEDPAVNETLLTHLEAENSDTVRQAAARALDGDVDIDLGGEGSGPSIQQAGDHVLNRPP